MIKTLAEKQAVEDLRIETRPLIQDSHDLADLFDTGFLVALTQVGLGQVCPAHDIAWSALPGLLQTLDQARRVGRGRVRQQDSLRVPQRSVAWLGFYGSRQFLIQGLILSFGSVQNLPRSGQECFIANERRPTPD